MAEIPGILGAIYTSADILNHFATHCSKWRILSDRLFDMKEGLNAAELSLESWQRKYDVQDRRPVLYMHVLFGRLGWERIQQTLGSIKILSWTIRDDVDRIVGRALLARPKGMAQEKFSGRYDKELVQECLRRIKRNTSWSRKFTYSVLGRADDLEMRLERLHRKLAMLERFSDYYLEKEHPDIFSTIKRLPGRRVILKVGSTQADAIQHKLLDALSAQKDAELLHHASGKGNYIHIGLSVPQLLKRDFAFLLNLDGKTHEVLVHPVKIKAISGRVPSSIPSAIPALISNKQEPCYILPSASQSDGFRVSLPPRNHLADLEYKDPLSTIIRNQHVYLGQQVLYPQDQVALASSIASGSFRLIGSRWLHFLDCKNIRWRRSADGQWTSMMCAAPGDTSITKTLEQCKSAAQERRDKLDLSKHIQIFRIGLLLTELALKTPISYIDYDETAGSVKVYISELKRDGEPLDATGVASQVEMKTNVLFGNIVFFCLSTLEDKEHMRDKDIEGKYYKDVLKDTEELEALVRADGKRTPGGSGGISTPRSGHSSTAY